MPNSKSTIIFYRYIVISFLSLLLCRKKVQKALCISFLLLIHSSLFAGSILRGPWIDQVLMPIYEGSFGYEYFPDYKSHSHKRKADRFVFTLENGAYFALSPDWAAELGMDLARSKDRSCVVDRVRESLQYAILDDVRGDPLALSVALHLAEVPTVALKDPARFHLGNFEGKLEMLLGKEWSNGPECMWRTYGSFGILKGSRGRAGWTGSFALQRRFCASHMLEARAEGAWGLGENRLRFRHFKGYGPIEYRFLDVFLSYAYTSEYGNLWKLDLFSRVISRNCPWGNLGTKLEWGIPFNL
jgi:hypothetical protein